LQSRPHISVAAMLQMGLEQKALDLAAFGLLLGLDLVDRPAATRAKTGAR